MMSRQQIPNETIEAIAEAELRKFGLWQKGWRHEFDHDFPKNKWIGLCSNYKRIIYTNAHYVEHGLNPEKIVDTIRHEIAHALDNGPTRWSRCGNKILVHDPVWRRYARHVGANPRATGRLEGYEAPDWVVAKKKEAKWTMVFVDGGFEEIRACPKFLVRMRDRNIRGRPETLKKLWLVSTKDWKAYLAGKLKAWQLKFWQENPNCSIWGDGAVAMQLPKPKLAGKVGVVKGEIEKCKDDPVYFAKNYLSDQERAEFIKLYPWHEDALRSMANEQT